MDWQAHSKAGEDTYTIPDRWLHLHYYEALNVLFRIENALRTFVYVVLKNAYGSKWSQLSITGDDGDSTIGAIAAKRRAQAGTFGYLCYPISSPLLYLNTGELTRLITSEPYWKHFAASFPAAKGILATKFEEINSVRNALAHFRPLRQDDVETVKQASKHILTKVESTLFDLLTCKDTVPTNTEEDWYQALSVLGNTRCGFSFAQSPDREWVLISLKYTPPIIGHSGDAGYHRFTVLTVDVPDLLGAHPTLTEVLTYATERVPFTRVDKDGNANFRKVVAFGFARHTLQNKWEPVRDGMIKLIGQISEETELIQKDNLARGQLVRSATASGHIKEGAARAGVNTKALSSAFGENDPPEWWGQIAAYAPDFISATHRYPWMPTDIASIQFVF